MLSELFEHLPEVGDPEKPSLVFFFDEAHLLFNDAPAALIEKVEQVVRLIRSKGVGVYFVTQSPADVPDNVLGQLGNRVQHALRAFTPRDQKAVKTAAQTLRANPKVDIEKAIMELAVGEALVSTLDPKGTPQITWRAWMVPPCSQIGPITDAARDQIRKSGQSMYGQYEKTVDRESAYEKLTARTVAKGGAATRTATAPRPPSSRSRRPAAGSTMTDLAGTLAGVLFGTTGPRGGHHDGLINSAAKSAARSVGSGVGRAILRGALGSILGGSSSGSRRSR